ncbi:MAG: hypothetical protein HY060_13350 [Proteobacteria bacterium]|nr:hypothetical protein [Pseudomonadota bacterium]
MAKSKKTKQMIVLSAGVAVGLSASAIVLLQSQSSPTERLKMIQSALRDGAATAQVSTDAPLIQLAARDFSK